MYRRLVPACAALAALAAAAPAAAVGPPPSATQSVSGIVSSSGDVRYVALNHGASTLVRALRVPDRKVLGEQLVPGRLGVPVAARTVTTGLSHDGRTLVLGEILQGQGGLPEVETSIAVLSTKLAAPARVFKLPGTFTVDAVSPDARWVYLIQRHGGDFTNYAVRAFDARAGRLVPGVIADKSEPGAMHGYPRDRVSTANGRFAFTLYAGMGTRSFVHALDTVNRSARCLDLPSSVKEDRAWGLRFRPTGDGRLEITDRGTSVASIDLASLRMTGAAAS